MESFVAKKVFEKLPTERLILRHFPTYAEFLHAPQFRY